MAGKKERKVKAVYTVFEYEDGGPMEAILPDGRMALLIDDHNLYEFTRSTITTGLIRRRSRGAIEILDDSSSSLEEARDRLLDHHTPAEISKMTLELRYMVSFN
jgi:hypothetical protein